MRFESNPKRPTAVSAEPEAGQNAVQIDPSSYQWIGEDGRRRSVAELSREELMQALCQSMDAIEELESMCMDQQAIFSAWHDGKFKPKNLDVDSSEQSSRQRF